MPQFQFTREQLDHAHFIIDYDGTLIPLVTTLEDGILPASTRKLLLELRDQYGLEISILSGRPLDFLKQQFEGTDIFLAGSHGAEFYNYKTKKTKFLVKGDKGFEFEKHRTFFKQLIAANPNSFIENKPYGVAIHYGKCATSAVPTIERALLDYVKQNADAFSIQGMICFQGKNVLEIKCQECNKGSYLETFKSETGLNIEKVYGFGDDENDEHIFKEINKFENGHTFRIIQSKATSAKYRLGSQPEFLEVLSRFLKART